MVKLCVEINQPVIHTNLHSVSTNTCCQRVDDINLFCSILDIVPNAQGRHSGRIKEYEAGVRWGCAEEETRWRRDGAAKAIQAMAIACSLCRVIGANRIRDLSKQHVYADGPGLHI